MFVKVDLSTIVQGDNMKKRFETFTVTINRISREIKRIKTEEMSEYNLKVPHVSCLYYLYQFGSLTAAQLCERCDENKAAISRALDYLEQEQYITCNLVDGKKYRCKLELTKKGQQVGMKLSKKIDALVVAASEGLSDEERQIMYKALDVISTNLNKIYKEKNNDKNNS